MRWPESEQYLRLISFYCSSQISPDGCRGFDSGLFSVGNHHQLLHKHWPVLKSTLYTQTANDIFKDAYMTHVNLKVQCNSESTSWHKGANCSASLVFSLSRKDKWSFSWKQRQDLIGWVASHWSRKLVCFSTLKEEFCSNVNRNMRS